MLNTRLRWHGEKGSDFWGEGPFRRWNQGDNILVLSLLGVDSPLRFSRTTLFLAWDVLLKWDQRGLPRWRHIPWRILFPALENLEPQFIKKSCNLRCCCIEQITPLPREQTQRLVTQNSPSSDQQNHAFQNKSPGAFCLNYLWILLLVSDLPFNTIGLVSCLSLNTTEWSFALFLAFAGQHAVPRGNSEPRVLQWTPWCFWPWPHSSEGELSGSLGRALISLIHAGVSECPGESSIKGPILTSALRNSLGALSASGGLGRPHWAAFIYRPFPEQRADWWQNGELNIYVWKTRKGQEERNLSASACWRNIICVSTCVPPNNAHFSHTPVRKITSVSCLSWVAQSY